MSCGLPSHMASQAERFAPQIVFIEVFGWPSHEPVPAAYASSKQASCAAWGVHCSQVMLPHSQYCWYAAAQAAGAPA